MILSGHVKDKLINKEGQEMTELELDLTGKLARIVCSRADAVGLVHRKKDKVYINFNGGGDSIIEARSKHLAGQTILLSEKNDQGDIIAHWDNIFTELSN